MNANISTASKWIWKRFGRTVIEEHHPACSSELLDELAGLRIILLLDLLVVREGCMFSRFLVVLEPGRVEGDGMLFTTEVLNNDLAFLLTRIPLALPCLWVSSGMRVRL